jgi:hypothetical protein
MRRSGLGAPSVGTFDIAPRPARGYGAGVTTQPAVDGLAAGAKWAWLQSMFGVSIGAIKPESLTRRT